MRQEALSETGGSTSFVDIEGIRFELIRRGSGRPILFLHGSLGIEPTAEVLDHFAERGLLLAPSHPGFGRSDLPRHVSTIEDLSYCYLDFLEQLDIHDAILVGVSMGAWIAADIAIKSSERISHLVLADPVGIKVSRPDARDVVDLFMISDASFRALAYADPAAGVTDQANLSEDEARIIARNREATALFGWLPYMHDPKLRHRLHRIRVPTLFLWGERDQIVSQAYVRAYAELVRGSRFEVIANAGHFPHIEQPETFAKRVFGFVDRERAGSS